MGLDMFILDEKDNEVVDDYDSYKNIYYTRGDNVKKDEAFSKLMIANSGNPVYNMGINKANRKAKLVIGKLIKEIEDLQKRSCNNCKYARETNLLGNISYGEKFCNELVRFFHNSFCCNKWESKC